MTDLQREALQNGVNLNQISESLMYSLKMMYDAGFDLGVKFQSNDEREE